jgi:uncharacterized OB-fold protein
MSDETGHVNLRELAEPFFRGCAAGKLLLPKCDRCERYYFYSTILCPHCHHKGFHWTESAGLGRIYTYTELFRPMVPELAAEVPYIVATVELDEDVRMMANVAPSGTLPLAIGARVQVGFRESWNGRWIPLFSTVAD